MNKIIHVLFLVIATSLYSQSSKESVVKIQADKMGKAFMNNDFQTFVKYSNPKLVKMIGGTKKMSEVVNKSIVDMKAKVMMFESITFSDPTKIVTPAPRSVQTTSSANVSDFAEFFCCSYKQ